MKYAKRKYIRAATTFCYNHKGHQFQIVTGQQKKNDIREQFPNMICALWECVHCDAIIEST